MNYENSRGNIETTRTCRVAKRGWDMKRAIETPIMDMPSNINRKGAKQIE